MATNYEVTYDKVTKGDDYLINHSGGVYVIDPAGPTWGFSSSTNRRRRWRIRLGTC